MDENPKMGMLSRAGDPTQSLCSSLLLVSDLTPDRLYKDGRFSAQGISGFSFSLGFNIRVT